MGAGLGHRLSAVFPAIALALALCGCSPYAWEGRYGPSVVISGDAVAAASENKLKILSALAGDAGYRLDTQTNWYLVSEAGFNYVDDVCRSYFNQLFFLNRERERAIAAISAFGQTTTAILGLTGSSVTTMAVVAQAFGLGSGLTDLAVGSYLYQLPPAAIQAFVRELQAAYRMGVSQGRSEINTPTAAYHVIQEYLSLCLPSVIEGKLVEYVGNARAFPVPPARGAGPSVGLSVQSVPPPSRAALQKAAGVSLEGPGATVPRGQKAETIPGGEVKKIQRALCVTPQDGLPDSPATREAVRKYLEALGKPQDTKFAGTTLTWLRLAVTNVVSCEEMDLKDPVGVAAYVKQRTGMKTNASQ